MERKLTRIAGIYHVVDGVRIEGVPSGITGDLSNVRGYLGGVSGDLSGVSGDLDDCHISDEERAAGIDINDLIDER